MDLERLRLSAHVTWVRTRSLGRTLIRAAAIGVVLLGMFNMFGPAAVGVEAVRPYPTIRPLATETGLIFFGDVVAIGGGAIVAWIV